jgi:hypothetical protein
MNDAEIDLVLAKNKADVLEACNYVHGQLFLVGKYFDERSSSFCELHKYCVDQISRSSCFASLLQQRSFPTRSWFHQCEFRGVTSLLQLQRAQCHPC